MKNNFLLNFNFLNIHKFSSEKSEVVSQIIYGEKFKILSQKKK